MGFTHGKSTGVLWHDIDLSAYLNEVSQAAEIEASETTTFGTGSKTYIPGLSDGTISLSGLFDDAGAGLNDVGEQLQSAVNRPLTTGIGGLTDGNQCKMADAISTSFEVSAAVADVVEATAEFQADAGVDIGVILEALESIATATTTDGTSVDNGASSANGAVGHVHVTTNGTSGDTTVKIQDSADDAAWADLISFTVVGTGVTTSERGTASGTVDRYLRSNIVTSGTGAVVVSVAAARR